ncbi:hypothetical protein ADK70_38510 [Streptomyces rimosus subsp. pseudoverticillatus]|nr:hypothetical protein ADK70_38510 [Streptomyces rimosus subsp. pseudoverticillatus]
MDGEDTDTERRGAKQPLLRSDCTFYCATEDIARTCIEELRSSDERLRSRPEELMLWDWQATYFEPEPDNAAGGGWVRLGVAWYDHGFFDDRRDAAFGVLHRRIYDRIGLTDKDITVTHWSRVPEPISAA